MLRYAIGLAGLVAVAGCSSSGQGPFSSTGAQDAQLAAYAASTPYPSTQQASDKLQAAAMIEKSGDQIRIVNFSDQGLRNAKVWVNGSFVSKVDYIPPHGSATVTRSQLFNNTGQNMSQMNITPMKIQLQTQNDMYNLMGPVYGG